MTQGDGKIQIVRFAMPVLLSQIFQQLYNTADALIVGRYLGDDALAAVSGSGTLVFMLVSFFIGTASGACVVISHFFGARDRDGVSSAIHTFITLAIMSGILLTIIGVTLTPTLLRWMNTAESVLPKAVSYFRWYFAGIIANSLYNACNGIMNALGDSRHPLYYLIVSSLTNIALDLLFIACFGWGVWAAALATVLSQTLSTVLCLIRLSGQDAYSPVRINRLGFDRSMLRRILQNGLPSGIQNSVIAFANVIVQTNINSFGATAMAGYGAYSKIEGFGFLPITSFTMAITTFVGQNLGAGERDRAKHGARFGIITAMILAEFIGIIIWFAAPRLIGLFTETQAVIDTGVTQCRTICLFYCLLAFSHAVAAVCRGAGHARVPMVIMLCCWCLLRVTYITLILRVIHDIRMIYLAYPITWTVSSVIYLIYFLRFDWTSGIDVGDDRR